MENIKASNMSKEQFDNFIKSDLVNFMAKYDLQNISINDGCGKKGVIRRGSQGEYKIQVTSNETL